MTRAETAYLSYDLLSFQNIMLKLYINFSQGAILTGIAERTGGKEFFVSDDSGVERLATVASQTSSESCDTEGSRRTVNFIKFCSL